MVIDLHVTVYVELANGFIDLEAQTQPAHQALGLFDGVISDIDPDCLRRDLSWRNFDRFEPTILDDIACDLHGHGLPDEQRQRQCQRGSGSDVERLR